MGKYSNVNATALKNVASTAIDELNNYNLSNVHNNLKNSNTMKSSASHAIKDSLYNIIYSNNINGSLKNLKNKLNNLVTAAEYIKRYQEAEANINKLNKKLYKKETSYEYSEDEDGNTITEEIVEWVIDVFVQAQINNLENNKTSYESKIDYYLG